MNPLGTMDNCPKFHGNPSSSCRHISLKAKNVTMMVVEEKSEITKVSRINPLAIMNVDRSTLSSFEPVVHTKCIYIKTMKHDSESRSLWYIVRKEMPSRTTMFPRIR